MRVRLARERLPAARVRVGRSGSMYSLIVSLLTLTLPEPPVRRRARPLTPAGPSVPTAWSRRKLSARSGLSTSLHETSRVCGGGGGSGRGTGGACARSHADTSPRSGSSTPVVSVPSSLGTSDLMRPGRKSLSASSIAPSRSVPQMPLRWILGRSAPGSSVPARRLALDRLALGTASAADRRALHAEVEGGADDAVAVDGDADLGGAAVEGDAVQSEGQRRRRAARRRPTSARRRGCRRTRGGRSGA